MEIIQECAKAFKNMVGTTSYVYHVSLNKKIKTFEIDFKTVDFHHAIGLQYLEDVSIPKNKKKTIDCVYSFYDGEGKYFEICMVNNNAVISYPEPISTGSTSSREMVVDTIEEAIMGASVWLKNCKLSLR